MGLEFELYELKDFPKEHMEMDRVWLLYNKDAMIITSWLHNNYIPRTEYDYTAMYQITSYSLDNLLQSIKQVLVHDKNSVDFFISFLLHFTLYQDIPGWSRYIESEDIYDTLVEYKNRINELIFDENHDLFDKEFVYRINW